MVGMVPDDGELLANGLVKRRGIARIVGRFN